MALYLHLTLTLSLLEHSIVFWAQHFKKNVGRWEGILRDDYQSPTIYLVLGFLPSTKLEMLSLKKRLEKDLCPLKICRGLLGKMNSLLCMSTVAKRNVLKSYQYCLIVLIIESVKHWNWMAVGIAGSLSQVFKSRSGVGGKYLLEWAKFNCSCFWAGR